MPSNAVQRNFFSCVFKKWSPNSTVAATFIRRTRQAGGESAHTVCLIIASGSYRLSAARILILSSEPESANGSVLRDGYGELRFLRAQD